MTSKITKIKKIHSSQAIDQSSPVSKSHNYDLEGITSGPYLLKNEKEKLPPFYFF